MTIYDLSKGDVPPLPERFSGSKLRELISVFNWAPHRGIFMFDGKRRCAVLRPEFGDKVLEGIWTWVAPGLDGEVDINSKTAPAIHWCRANRLAYYVSRIGARHPELLHNKAQLIARLRVHYVRG